MADIQSLNEESYDILLDRRNLVYVTEAQVAAKKALRKTLEIGMRVKKLRADNIGDISESHLKSRISVQSNDNSDSIQDDQKFKYNCWRSYQKYSVENSDDENGKSKFGLPAKNIHAAINCVLPDTPPARISGFLNENNITENQILTWKEFHYFCFILLGPILNLSLNKSDVKSFQTSKQNNNHPFQQLLREQRGLNNLNYEELKNTPEGIHIIDSKMRSDMSDAVIVATRRSFKNKYMSVTSTC